MIPTRPSAPASTPLHTLTGWLGGDLVERGEQGDGARANGEGRGDTIPEIGEKIRVLVEDTEEEGAPRDDRGQWMGRQMMSRDARIDASPSRCPYRATPPGSSLRVKAKTACSCVRAIRRSRSKSIALAIPAAAMPASF